MSQSPNARPTHGVFITMGLPGLGHLKIPPPTKEQLRQARITASYRRTAMRALARHPKRTPAEYRVRNQVLAYLHCAAGFSYRTAGQVFGLSTERTRQIVLRTLARRS